MSDVKERGFNVATAALEQDPAQAFAAAAEVGHPEIAESIRADHGLHDHLCATCGQAKHHMSPRSFPYKGRDLRVCNSCASLRFTFEHGEWIYHKKQRQIPR